MIMEGRNDWKRFKDEYPQPGRNILRAFVNELGGITYYADKALEPELQAKYNNLLTREHQAPVQYWWRYFDELKLVEDE